jgi:integrase
VVLDPASDPPRRLATVSECIGETTSNVAEYRALIAGLRAAEPFGARVARVRADSKLVIEQLSGRWKVRADHLRPLLREARELLARYDEVDLRHVLREENADADAPSTPLDATPLMVLGLAPGAIFGVWNVPEHGTRLPPRRHRRAAADTDRRRSSAHVVCAHVARRGRGAGRRDAHDRGCGTPPRRR